MYIFIYFNKLFKLLMQEIQRGEVALQQGNIEIALEKFGIAAALSYCLGG